MESHTKMLSYLYMGMQSVRMSYAESSRHSISYNCSGVNIYNTDNCSCISTYTTITYIIHTAVCHDTGKVWYSTLDHAEDPYSKHCRWNNYLREFQRHIQSRLTINKLKGIQSQKKFVHNISCKIIPRVVRPRKLMLVNQKVNEDSMTSENWS